MLYSVGGLPAERDQPGLGGRTALRVAHHERQGHGASHSLTGGPNRKIPTMNTALQFLSHSWWRYSPSEPFGYSHFYHWFNVAEGTAWCVIGALAARRFQKRRKSRWELVYVAAYISFGVTDFVEARALTTWLILFKGANLLLLFYLRSYLLRRHYAESKTF